MFGLYTEKQVKRLITRLREEYAAALQKRTEYIEEQKKEIRTLRARVLELESERESVAGALISAEKESKRLREKGAKDAENERREYALLIEKCRLLSERLMKKYPDEEESAKLSAYTDELYSQLDGEEESGFNLDEVLNPQKPLDLGELCRELGLMEEPE